MIYLYSEIFDQYTKAATKEDKIAVLRKHDHKQLREFFHYLYSPNIIFEVTIPTYKPAKEPAGLNFTYLDIEMSKMYRFIKDHEKRTNTTPERREALLVGILESLHKDEAELLIGLIRKDLGIKYLTPLMVKEAYPDLDI